MECVKTLRHFVLCDIPSFLDFHQKSITMLNALKTRQFAHKNRSYLILLSVRPDLSPKILTTTRFSPLDRMTNGVIFSHYYFSFWLCWRCKWVLHKTFRSWVCLFGSSPFFVQKFIINHHHRVVAGDATNTQSYQNSNLKICGHAKTTVPIHSHDRPGV